MTSFAGGGADAYVALGDSISIDVYAGGPGRGGASLLARNRDDDYGAGIVRQSDDLGGGVDRAQTVRDVRERHQARLLRQKLP